MSRNLNPYTLLITLLLTGALALLAGGGLYIYQKHQWAQSRLNELEPRYARLKGLMASTAEIEQAQTQTQAILARYVYPAEQDASQVGNMAQQRVRDLFTAAGLQIVSSQVLPAKTDKGFDLIPLSVRAEGELIALQGGLVALSGQNPAILLKGVNVQTIGSVRADTPQRLGAQFELFVLRVHQPS